MNEFTLLTLFLIVNFFHGVFSSGFVPILNKELGVDSALPFAMYFLWLLIGQFLIYKYSFLSKSKKSYAIYEMFFGLSLIFMSFFNGKIGFNIGRGLEGLAAGLTTPVLFANILNLEKVGSPEKRLVMFSSITALGFVIGPFLLSFIINFFDYKSCLFAFGLFFIFSPILIFFMKEKKQEEDEKLNLSIKGIFSDKRWFEKFSSLFLLKCFFGFFMTFLSSHLMTYFPSGTNINYVILSFSITFIIGQIVTANISKFFKNEYIAIYFPLMMFFCGVLFLLTKNPYWFCFAGFFHSGLNFVAYMNFNQKSTSAREFAFYSIITDPFMVLGSLYATLGINGLIPLLIIYPLPFIRYLLSPSNKIRSEYFFPVMGGITIYKTINKHFNPLKISSEQPIIDKMGKEITYENYNSEKNGEKVSFIFTGDLCPSNIDYYFSKEIKDFLKTADFRCLNLEGVQISDNSEKTMFHDIRKSLFDSIILEENNFNIVSFSNNHALDLGIDKYKNTLEKYKNNNFNLITSELTIKNIRNIKIGFFSATFGSNLFWRKTEEILSLKPEDFLSNLKKQTKFIELIKKYKSQVDILVLSYHWGYECEYLPSDIQNRCFEILKDNGVDILYGHHSHIVQPYEISEDKTSLCLYSCGNLITAVDMKEKVYQQGVFYNVEVEKDNDKFFISKVKSTFFDSSEKEIKIIKKDEMVIFN